MISDRGLVNGFVLLDAADYLRPFVRGLGTAFGFWAPENEGASSFGPPRLIFGPKEPPAEAIARFRRWLDGITVPEGTRFGIQDWLDEHEDGRKTRVGVRSLA